MNFRVILSTDDKRHAQFIPLACSAWKKFFPECKITVVIVPEKEKVETLREQYVQWCDELRFVENVSELPYPNVCKLARMWAAGQYGEEIILVEDMDLVICNRAYTESLLAQRHAGNLMLVGEEVYIGNKRLEGQCPMGKATAESNLWKEIANPQGLNFPDFLAQFKQVRVFHEDAGESPYDSAQDFSDESLLRVLVSRWTKKDANIDHVHRNYNIQLDTLDRAWWRIDKDKLNAGGYYEAHLMKPLWHFVHYEQMLPLFEYIGVGEYYRSLYESDANATRILLVQPTAGYRAIYEALQSAGVRCDRWIMGESPTEELQNVDKYSIIACLYSENMPYLGADLTQLLVCFEQPLPAMEMSKQRNWCHHNKMDELIPIQKLVSDPKAIIAECRSKIIAKVDKTLAEIFTVPAQPILRGPKRATIALNIISCDADAENLNRCLESFRVHEFFDEIVIGNTNNSQKVREVALLFDAKVIDTLWDDEEFPFGNFARARNTVLDATTSNYVMWLDCDDVLLNQYDDKWLNFAKLIRDHASEIDTYILPYTVFIDEEGKPLTTFMRQRVWKQDVGFRWRNAVHEQLCLMLENYHVGEVGALHITHLPGKPPTESSSRNLKILEDEIVRKKSKNAQLRFFYARDLLVSGKYDQGISLAWEIISELDTDFPTLYNLSLDALMLTAYSGYSYAPIVDMLKEESLDAVESFARIAMALSISAAEPYVLLGDVYYRRKEVKAAAKMYQIALTKKTADNVAMQFTPYYREIPADRLSDVSINIGDYERALVHNREAISCNRYNPYYLRKRLSVMKILAEQTNELCGGEK